MSDIKDMDSDREEYLPASQLIVSEKENLYRNLKRNILGRSGVGAVVGVLTFYTNNPSSNPAQIYNFSVKIVVEKNKNNEQK